MNDSELRIPTKELTVELAVREGQRSTVTVRLAEHEQHLIDLLESDQRFIAVCDTESGWSILNKHKLLWASIILTDGRLPIEEEQGEAPLYDKQVEVRVEFTHSEALEGKMLYSPPEGKSRVTDHLNQTGSFFRLWTSHHLYLINKHHLLRVVETKQE
jgi:hypothetical protein